MRKVLIGATFAVLIGSIALVVFMLGLAGPAPGPGTNTTSGAPTSTVQNEHRTDPEAPVIDEKAPQTADDFRRDSEMGSAPNAPWEVVGGQAIPEQGPQATYTSPGR